MTEANNPRSFESISPNQLVRLRPGMYFGSTDEWALHNVLFELLDDSVDEALWGHCDHIWLTLLPNTTVMLRDNSRGLPVHIFKDGRNFLEHIMLERGTRRVDGNYEVQGGMIGLGLGAVNALSTEFVVEVARDGSLWRQTYREGVPQTEVQQVRPLEPGEATGTILTFTPDFTILEANSFNYQTIAERMRELAYLVPGLRLTLRDEREDAVKAEEFCFPNGLADYIHDLNQGRVALHQPRFGMCEWTMRSKNKSERVISADVVFQYSDTMETQIISYVNTTHVYGGAHMDTMRAMLASRINLYRAIQREEPPFREEEILPGLTLIIRFKYPHPSYSNAREREIINKDVGALAAEAVADALMGENWQELPKIVEKCVANREALQNTV